MDEIIAAVKSVGVAGGEPLVLVAIFVSLPCIFLPVVAWSVERVGGWNVECLESCLFPR